MVDYQAGVTAVSFLQCLSDNRKDIRRTKMRAAYTKRFSSGSSDGRKPRQKWLTQFTNKTSSTYLLTVSDYNSRVKCNSDKKSSCEWEKQWQQGDSRLHFAHAVQCALPSITLWQRWNSPICCCMTLFAASALQCIANGEENPPKLPLPLGFCHPARGRQSHGSRQQAGKIW